MSENKEKQKVIGVQVSDEVYRIYKQASAFYTKEEGRFISIRELIHRYAKQLAEAMNNNNQ